MTRKAINTLSLSILGFICSSPLLAATPYKDEVKIPSPSHVVISLGGGEAYARKLGESTTFSSIDSIDMGYTYHFDDEHKSSPFFNAFIGGQWPLTSYLDVQAGFGYYYIDSFTAKGTVTQSPSFQTKSQYKTAQAASIVLTNQYDVHYHVRSQQLLFDTKWLYAPGHYHPYLSVGLGGSLNTAGGFEAEITQTAPPVGFKSAMIPAPTVSRTFEDHDSNSFTYALGLGLDVDINAMTRIGIGYRYSDLGKVKLGDSSVAGVPQPGTLSQSHVYTNDVIAQLTFLF